MAKRGDAPEVHDQPPTRTRDGDLQSRLEGLPDNHPSSPRYAPAADGSDRRLPPERAGHAPRLSDHEYAAHTEIVEARLAEAESRGVSTDVQHTRDPDRKIWTRERDLAHEALIADLLADAADVPSEGRAVIAGGLGGAGKSTVLGEFAGIDQSRYLTVNPDLIKERMAARGMIPEIEGLSPMERSPLVHEESSHIAKRLSDRAYAERKNVIWDITMSSRASVERRIDDLRAAGYQHVEGVFVDIPVEVSVRRALGRHRDGLERFRNGDGPGGRYVPPDLIRQQRTADGGTVNRQVFESVKDRFDRWSVYDNSVDGRDPLLTETSDDREERP